MISKDAFVEKIQNEGIDKAKKATKKALKLIKNDAISAFYAFGRYQMSVDTPVASIHVYYYKRRLNEMQNDGIAIVLRSPQEGRLLSVEQETVSGRDGESQHGAVVISHNASDTNQSAQNLANVLSNYAQNVDDLLEATMNRHKADVKLTTFITFFF